MKTANFAAILILAGMFFIMLFSSISDSATFDEVAHISAGFSYLTQKDSRINPEHPPLIKDLATFPLLFLHLKSNFEKQESWSLKNVNDRQWALGGYFLYESGNNPDKILFWSRLPIIILTIIFGFIIFWWTRKNYGVSPALLALLFFALSPTFLAHGRYVTTDLGAALAFFLSIIFFVRFLQKNNKKSLLCFGLVLGFSLLIKFSLIILLPFFVIMGIIYSKERFLYFLFRFFLASLTALILIWFFYVPHIWNYPLEQNLADAHYTLDDYKTAKFAPELAFTLLSNKFTQPLGQYLHGFLMVLKRTAGGNNAYFLGEISSKGWISYFPTLFFTKEQIGLYILMLFLLILAIRQRKKIKNQQTTIFLAFITYYWVWSLWSPLNIGIRHILPTFPFLYILVSKEILEWVGRNIKKVILISIIIFWMAIEVAVAYPFFLSYYNILGGGLKNGHKIATDSNYDWGQDLKRLKFWMQKNNIEKIYLDYFGGGSPKYYLGNKYIEWYSAKGLPPIPSPIENQLLYFAVSINTLSGAQAKAIGNLTIKPEDSYNWLTNKKPKTRAGSSIFIFSF